MRKYKQVHIKSGKIAQIGRNFGWDSRLYLGQRFLLAFLASISYLWLALTFILVFQPQ